MVNTDNQAPLLITGVVQDPYSIRWQRKAKTFYNSMRVVNCTARNDIGTHNRRVSAQTVLNRLRDVGMFNRRPVKGFVHVLQQTTSHNKVSLGQTSRQVHND